ncbi:MAG: exonuclease domain-containing protein [Flavonifractor plautii]
MGFIAEGCRRMGRPFDSTSIDTLILAQNLLPELGKHKLDIVAEHLNLPAFNHHRAYDDAATVGYMLVPFFEMLAGQGCTYPPADQSGYGQVCVPGARPAASPST